jgi:hypothetical protein
MFLLGTLVGLFGSTIAFGSDWQVQTCSTLFGISFAFEAMSGVLIVTKLVIRSPGEGVRCWSVATALFGIYACSIVGVSLVPPFPIWTSTHDCLPRPVTAATLAFCVIMVVYSCLEFCMSIPCPPGQRRLEPAGLTPEELAGITIIYVLPPAGFVQPLTAVTTVTTPEPPTAEPELCAICLETLTGEIRQLRCAHRFHARCIDPWLRAKNACALCRQPAVLTMPQTINPHTSPILHPASI